MNRQVGIGSPLAMALRTHASANPILMMGAGLRNFYTVEAYRGSLLLWREEFENLVTTAGKNHILSTEFVSGTQVTTWYVGLKGTGSVSASDTMSSHAGWSENVTYSESVRQTWTPGSVSAGSVDNTASRAVFSINGSTTIYGCFLTTVNTKSGTTGTLYGAGDFSASRALDSGDTLNVGITLTAS